MENPIPPMGGLTASIYFIISKALLIKTLPTAMNKQSCGHSDHC